MSFFAAGGRRSEDAAELRDTELRDQRVSAGDGLLVLATRTGNAAA